MTTGISSLGRNHHHEESAASLDSRGLPSSLSRTHFTQIFLFAVVGSGLVCTHIVRSPPLLVSFPAVSTGRNAAELFFDDCYNQKQATVKKGLGGRGRPAFSTVTPHPMLMWKLE